MSNGFDRLTGRALRIGSTLRLLALLVGALSALFLVTVATADDTSPSCLTEPPEDKYFCATTTYISFGRVINRLGWQGSMGNNPNGEFWKLRKIEIWHRDTMGNPERAAPTCCGAEARSHTNQTWPNPGFTYAYDNVNLVTSGDGVVAYFCGVFHERAYFDFALGRVIPAHDTDLQWTTEMTTGTGEVDPARPFC